MKSSKKPTLFIGYKGVVVESAPWYKPQVPVEGIRSFLAGVEELEGVEIMGIISARSSRRRQSVVKGIVKAGLTDYFPDPLTNHSTLSLTGNQTVKARSLASRANSSVVGMIDARPDKVASALVRAMAAQTTHTSAEDANPEYRNKELPKRRVIIGTMAPCSEEEHLQAFLSRGAVIPFPYVITSQPKAFGKEAGIWAPGHGFTVEAVALPQLSYETGQQFGRRLLEAQVALG